ncbi:MAG: RidA family protein [Alphaproteobacteria bacterium]|jgi:enamine deaminase RidA (YjgF/YER057c/UK114 family)|nr:RidA family protein [Alphaproteobacteria bacterium]
MSAEATMKNLGIELPEAPTPMGSYVGAVRTGNLVYISGQGPRNPDGSSITGKVGTDGMSIEDAQAAARQVGLNALATLRAEIGDLDQVKQVVKVLGMVNATPDFKEHPRVINGFSDLMFEIFGEAGRHARSAVGMSSLPFQIPVEVEMIVELV